METKRVLLIGRAGSGKSTVATMLYKRCIDSNNDFNVSDSLSGATVRTTTGISIDERWEIYDTVGLGEGLSGSIPNGEARKMLLDMLKNVQDTFHYICMLKSLERFGEDDDEVINFIRILFSKKDLETNMITILKTKNKNWIHENEEMLSTKYNIDVTNAITVDFPSYKNRKDYDSDEEDDMIEEKNARRRTKSLIRLENFLLSRNVLPVRARIYCIAYQCGKYLEDKSLDCDYCALHKCRKCTDGRFPNSEYCAIHQCRTCLKGSSPHSRYCVVHQCRKCSEGKFPGSNFCTAHQCRTCRKGRKMGSEYCRLHSISCICGT